MTKTFPDGTIELAWSGNGSPPGATGQHTNVSTIWFRVDEGTWERASCRTMHKNGHWHVQFCLLSEEYQAWGKTLPEAICKARMYACGIDWEKLEIVCDV